MLMHNQERHYVVESNRFGIMQHDPFSWVVDGRDFRYAVRLSDSARYFDRTLNGWLSTQTDEKRALFVDVLFSAVGSMNATTVGELLEGAWFKGALSMIKAYKSADEETRQMVMQAVKSLAVALATNFRGPAKSKRTYLK
jgi:hypothetical protein